jgi:hypothetical protein
VCIEVGYYLSVLYTILFNHYNDSDGPTHLRPQPTHPYHCPGDFNTSPDRHLAGAVLPRLAPDLIISEATYAAAVREGRGARETGLLAAVAAAVGHGGKVLVPVFAVGRAQELLAALDELWDRQGLQVCGRGQLACCVCVCVCKCVCVCVSETAAAV